MASGSKGNALWIEADGQAILVDAGLPGKEIVRRLTVAGLDPAAIAAIVVTHEHRDHVSGVGIMARRLKIPVYLNTETHGRAKSMLGPIDGRLFRTGREFSLGALRVRPYSISHDSADPVGFVFEHGPDRLGLATDLGVATNLVRNHLLGCQTLILEANHDPDMLMNGPYPWELKQRVRGRHGHLSNHDAAELLGFLAHPGLRQVVLAHLSETNNRPDLALELIRSAVTPPSLDFRITAADQYRPGPVLPVGPR